MFDRKSLKAEAKKNLKGHYGTPVLIMLVLFGIQLILNLAQKLNAFGIFGKVFFTLCLIALAGIFAYGLAKFFLNYRDNNQLKFSYFWAESNKKEIAGPSILGFLLVYIFTLLWSLLLIVPGIIKYYSYSMTFFILAENPKIPVTKAIKMSRLMMKGYKGKVFLLDLSFLGWFLLGIITLGIGFLWIAPYNLQARANAYVVIKEEALKSGVITSADYE
ncbi:MAG: DUF975 family protein [Treponema sp.]|nr:DUF975 family protein [Spirochaetia bacterium]MDD7458896.1 DUF975 family protein [Spirochaetales bacterium]MDY5810475.1 DUF975 family protein [Treponema sp.]MEE1180654.1 DUF975 family protein [Treponema sp.]